MNLSTTLPPPSLWQGPASRRGRCTLSIICVDHKTICADGLVECGGIITSTTDKKIVKRDGVIYATMGARCVREALINWHQRGHNPADAPKAEGGWTLIVVNKDGVAQYLVDAPYPDYFQPPWAWGANAEMAITLMWMGKTAAEAVKQMCEWSIFIGGEIQVENITEAAE